jgi:hypothetical protein
LRRRASPSPPALAVTPAAAQDLPDLGRAEVVIVTENAYPPLQFIDPSRARHRLEYDAIEDLAERLNCTPCDEKQLLWMPARKTSAMKAKADGSVR